MPVFGIEDGGPSSEIGSVCAGDVCRCRCAVVDEGVDDDEGSSSEIDSVIAEVVDRCRRDEGPLSEVDGVGTDNMRRCRRVSTDEFRPLYSAGTLSMRAMDIRLRRRW